MSFRPTGFGARPRLMIADDDLLTQSLFESCLGGDFEVVGVVGDGAGAVVLAEMTLPDVALVDVQMPGGGGLRATRGIVDVSPETAVVIVSSDEQESTVRELMEAGATSYQRKGISAGSLAQALTHSIEAHGGRASEDWATWSL